MRLPLCLLAIGLVGCSNKPEAPTIAELTTKLERDNPQEQMEAAAWIRQLGPQAAETAPLLTKVLKSSSRGMVRQSMVAALGDIGPKAAEHPPTVPALMGALADPDASVRSAAALALGQLGPAASSAIPALETARLKDTCGSAEAALKKIRKE